ncbi:hypothetical protein BKA62DRAFT_638633 [Auriculariales sp. MPI-PUGE-AT-0066]|nr:hypothetical protein BKA62DRAFT_638633 [Auriculariales sp. MPI-PUGE-AT-0066]
MAETEHAQKKARTASDDYELIYWPGIPGRGEPMRLLFEEAGVDYRDTAKGKDGIDRVLAAIKPGFEPGGQKDNIPPLAPPMLRAGDLFLSQSPNILLFLGERLPGLIPGDVSVNKYRVNQLALTALDLQNEAHDTHHPVATSAYYDDQKPEAKRAAAEFRDSRIPKFFGYFERVISSSEGPYLLFEFSYADLVLWHVLDGCQFAFPKAVARTFEKNPKLKELYDTVAARARIAAYLGSDRRANYGDGIYRYYEELDE